MTRAEARRRGLVVGAALVVLLVALLVGALGRWVAVVAVAALLLTVAEVVLHRLLARAFPLQLSAVLGELYARLPLEQALVLVLVVRTSELSWVERAVVVVAVVVHQLLRMAHSAVSQLVGRIAVPRAQVKGLPGTVLPRRPRTPLIGEPGLLLLVAANGLPALGLLVAALTGSYAAVVSAAVLMVAVGAAVLAASAPGVLALLRRPRGGAALATVHEAVVRHRPEVVLYSGDGGERDPHWVRPWLDTLDTLQERGRPALVVVRDQGLLDVLPPSATPVVCLPETYDVLPFALPDARVALYVANTADNIRLLRNPNLRSAFIGHGDSDKASSANPIAKMYDEVWVAGEAGRDRYLKADVGVRTEQIRIVGRPQVRHVEPGRPLEPGAPCTVLYAPTWEGARADAAESSVLHSGLEVVRRLLRIPGVRVLYRPHSITGSRDSAYARASERIFAELAEAGPPHGAVESPGTDIYAAINMADVLVTDVTSVISDYIASGKPYVVVNSTDLDACAFQEEFPSTAGAAIVPQGAEGLEAAIADARGPDTLRAARARVRLQLIGPPTDDPVGLFEESIDALGDTLRPRGTRAGAIPAGVAEA